MNKYTHTYQGTVEELDAVVEGFNHLLSVKRPPAARKVTTIDFEGGVAEHYLRTTRDCLIGIVEQLTRTAPTEIEVVVSVLNSRTSVEGYELTPFTLRRGKVTRLISFEYIKESNNG